MEADETFLLRHRQEGRTDDSMRPASTTIDWDAHWRQVDRADLDEM
jgi:hypothetical protein